MQKLVVAVGARFSKVHCSYSGYGVKSTDALSNAESAIYVFLDVCVTNLYDSIRTLFI